MNSIEDNLNKIISKNNNFNTKKAREEIKSYLENLIIKNDFIIKCDEENNPPDIVDRGVMNIDIFTGDMKKSITLDSLLNHIRDNKIDSIFDTN